MAKIMDSNAAVSKTKSMDNTEIVSNKGAAVDTENEKRHKKLTDKLEVPRAPEKSSESIEISTVSGQ